jgi:hypothetical protein
MRHQLVAHSSSPKPTEWSGVRTAGTPARTAVRITELSVRTNATANSKGGRTSVGKGPRATLLARIIHEASALGV